MNTSTLIMAPGDRTSAVKKNVSMVYESQATKGSDTMEHRQHTASPAMLFCTGEMVLSAIVLRGIL